MNIILFLIFEVFLIKKSAIITENIYLELQQYFLLLWIIRVFNAIFLYLISGRPDYITLLIIKIWQHVIIPLIYFYSYKFTLFVYVSHDKTIFQITRRTTIYCDGVYNNVIVIYCKNICFQYSNGSCNFMHNGVKKRRRISNRLMHLYIRENECVIKQPCDPLSLKSSQDLHSCLVAKSYVKSIWRLILCPCLFKCE